MHSYTFGMTPHGLLSFTPGPSGNLRVVGEEAADHLRRMFPLWAEDAELAICSARYPRTVTDPDVLKQNTVASGIPESASVLNSIATEVAGRGPGDTADPILVVLDGVDDLLAPAAWEPGPDGSIHELERQSALVLSRALNNIVRAGPRTGVSVVGIWRTEPDDRWLRTTTLRSGARPSSERDGLTVEFTWT